jgi:thioredoxin 1
MSHKTLKLTQSNFEETALRKDGVPVLVDFWATWCGPCRAMEPVLESLANEFEGRAIIGKVNVDEEPNLAAAARVQAIPTLVLLKDGKVEDVLVGMQPKEKLRARLDRLAGGATHAATTAASVPARALN